MVVIKSGCSSDQLTIDATAKAARATLYASGGSELGSEYSGNARPMAVQVHTNNTTGVYLTSYSFLVRPTAHSPTDAFLWICNIAGNTEKFKLRRVELVATPTTFQRNETAPRLTLERFPILSGTPVAPTLAAAARDPISDAQMSAILAGSSAGFTTGIVGGPTFYSFFIPPIITFAGSIGIPPPIPQEFEPENDGMVVIPAGYAILLRQADPGLAADSRKFVINFAWEEYLP